MSAPLYYEDDAVTLYHGDCREILPELASGSVEHVITDPPYSEGVHATVRSARMRANDRGGKYGADTRRNVNLGFEHLSPELRTFCAAEFARLASRWVLVFSDVESDHLWRDDLTGAGLDYVRTGAWIKVGSTPQFSGDRPATGFEAITIAHPPGRKRWNGGGVSRCVVRAHRARSRQGQGALASDPEAAGPHATAGRSVHRSGGHDSRSVRGVGHHAPSGAHARASRDRHRARRTPLRVGSQAPRPRRSRGEGVTA